MFVLYHFTLLKRHCIAGCISRRDPRGCSITIWIFFAHATNINIAALAAIMFPFSVLGAAVLPSGQPRLLPVVKRDLDCAHDAMYICHTQIDN